MKSRPTFGFISTNSNEVVVSARIGAGSGGISNEGRRGIGAGSGNISIEEDWGISLPTFGG